MEEQQRQILNETVSLILDLQIGTIRLCFQLESAAQNKGSDCEQAEFHPDRKRRPSMTTLSLTRCMATAGVLSISLLAFTAGSPAISSKSEASKAASAWNVAKTTVGYTKRRYKQRKRRYQSAYHWHTNADYRAVTTPVSHSNHSRFYGFGLRGDGYRTSGKTR